MRVLVCGGREFQDAGWLWSVLDGVHAETPISGLIAGGARGADTHSVEWAEARGIAVQVFEADWAALKRAAGPIRNQRMLDEGVPDLVIAFPGGCGTADMVQQAKATGVPVKIVGA